MLSHVSIKNYQSLGDIALDLKPFTVIVGPSSSGKSAFTRALKTLTSNQRGDSFISHGEIQCVIKAITDRGTVALLRGKKNEYVLIPENDTTQQQSFTKLAGAVPEEVSTFLGIPASDPLNYADQFDMPYMLKRSGGDVARELGALTNVSVIFEASREANRRRLAASSTLKTRAADYEGLTINLDKYRTLKEDMKNLVQAKELLGRARDIETRISQLDSFLTSLKNIPDIPTPRNIPDTSHAVEMLENIRRIEALIKEEESSRAMIAGASEKLAELAMVKEQYEEEYLEVLRDAGTCPTCGQETGGLHDTDTHRA